MKPSILLPILGALAGCVLLPPPARAASSSAQGPNIRVDTRDLTMTTLVISGPSAVPWGQDASYTAILNFEGTGPEDVTTQCTWSVTGGPAVTNFWELASMDGHVLKPGVVSSVPLNVSASITRNNGRIVSSTLSVTVTEGNGMNVGIERRVGDGPNYAGNSGANFIWNYGAAADGLAVMKPGVTIVWYLGGVQVGTGESLSASFTGTPGTRELKVIATDTGGRVGQAVTSLVFNVPPAANEPELVEALDPGVGELIGEDPENPGTFTEFAFDPLKTPYGLMVVTHGLNGRPSDQWLQHLARSIRMRLEDEIRPLPNIVVYGWEDWARPSQHWGVDVPYGGFIENLLLIRPHGLSLGRELADWIQAEIGRGNVSASAPVHLIGHSAGGFLVGECGYQMRSRLGNVRVTMLDTPYPALNHLTGFPGTGRSLDRYVSSLFGSLENPLATVVEAVTGKYDYILLGLMPTPSAHSYSHEWYEDTVYWGSIGAKGFGWSPVWSASPAPMPGPPADAPQLAPQSDDPPIESETPMAGFATFGSVISITDGYEVSEGNQANSGIMLAGYAMPVGAQTIRFRLRFTNPGDGDFLAVSHGETVIGYGADNTLSQSEEVTVHMPVEHLAGQTGDLVFRLMSRGEQNAVVTITAITLVEVEDPDLDNLSNAEELAHGTNPLRADTDGDGLDDAHELNTSLTDPQRADSDGDGRPDGSELIAGTGPRDPLSRLAITSAAWVPGGFVLGWSAVAGKTYRVVRSPTPGFESYDVTAAGVPAVVPETTRTDTTIDPGNEPRMFYRVEVE